MGGSSTGMGKTAGSAEEAAPGSAANGLRESAIGARAETRAAGLREAAVGAAGGGTPGAPGGTARRHSGAGSAGIDSDAVDPGGENAGLTGGPGASRADAAVGASDAGRACGGRAAIVTAGGSAYPDLVVERLAGLADEGGAHGVPTAVVLRSGAYLVHDDGFYSGISPLAAGRSEHPLRSAMHGWARCVSRPEVELALLDAGKRDLPFDEGLPVPQRMAGPASMPLPEGARVSALNDQHTFLRLPGGSDTDIPVGSVVRLGLSHPCTAFDKWRLIPVIDDAEAERPLVVGFLPTYF
ncbi:hypothetical protein GPX89_38720 [Nocardia sp. ET3-3]|uniref:D-serine dehydratase-like domain-containing protein n=2 Tax=Nocardia terrae TaxID=2675851 RepID=A0A7K1V9I5_9NOCA|nr:hypothetical protein [Nocardia terrae]